MEQTNVSPKPINAAKFVFLYLVHLVSLIFTVISFGLIIFQAINKWIPDAVNLYNANYNQEPIRFGIAALFVFAPIFYIVSRYINRALFAGEIKHDSAVRRWLTYLILFVSFLVFVGYLVSFVIGFLNGELTLRFILKTITVLAIAATVFSFYFYDIKRQNLESKKDKVIKIYFLATLSACAIVFVGSFFVVDSPLETRAKKLDENIISNFYVIDNCLDLYYRGNNSLPDNFEQLKKDCNSLLPETIKDSATGKAFEYHKKADKTYELCAEFRLSNKNAKDAQYNMYGPNGNVSYHDAGWQCLERKILFDVNLKQ